MMRLTPLAAFLIFLCAVSMPSTFVPSASASTDETSEAQETEQAQEAEETEEADEAQEPDPPWLEEFFRDFDHEVREMRVAFYEEPADPQSVEWVQRKITHMVEVDQFMRRTSIDAHRREDWDQERKDLFSDRFTSRWVLIDSQHTEELKMLVELHGWPTNSAFGEKTAKDAWLLAQHADFDPAFQRQVLELMEPLVEKDEVHAKNFAYLYDRVAVADERPQRYATQGRCVGKGTWEPRELEDAENVDALRAEVGLGTLEEYKKAFLNICP